MTDTGFGEVTNYIPAGQKLYHASTPNYDGHDKLTRTAIDFLIMHDITRIINLNKCRHSEEDIELLKSVDIVYHHLPVEDFQAPTLSQLTSAVGFFYTAMQTGTLVYCGYSDGRAGTIITALQLFSSWGDCPPEREWTSINHVETPAQMGVLRQLRSRYRNQY